jgi:hypothetical protein
MAELDELYCSSKLAALNHSKTEGLGERSADPSLKESIHQGIGVGTSSISSSSLQLTSISHRAPTSKYHIIILGSQRPILK